MVRSSAYPLSVKQGSSFVAKSLGKFLITAVHHSINSDGAYVNRFEGYYQQLSVFLSGTIARPTPDMLLATVFDNTC